MANPRVIDVLRESTKKEFDFNLQCISGRGGLRNTIVNAINRPGLALNNLYYKFGEERIQLFGRGEIAYLHDLERKGLIESTLESLFKHNVPCCLISHIKINTPPPTLIELCEKYNCPLLTSTLSTYELSVALFRLLNILFSTSINIHGTFIEVFDVGVLIQGKSGVGKSEAALELLAKGSHRLIADDVVELKRTEGTTVIGQRAESASHYKYHLEIRGLGIVSVSQIYGISSTLDKKSVSLVVSLLHHSSPEAHEKYIDRLVSEKTIDFLGVKFPLIEIIVKPGRNIPILIEVAALQHRIKLMGYHEKEDPFLW